MFFVHSFSCKPERNFKTSSHLHVAWMHSLIQCATTSKRACKNKKKQLVLIATRNEHACYVNWQASLSFKRKNLNRTTRWFNLQSCTGLHPPTRVVQPGSIHRLASIFWFLHDMMIWVFLKLKSLVMRLTIRAAFYEVCTRAQLSQIMVMQFTNLL